MAYSSPINIPKQAYTSCVWNAEDNSMLLFLDQEVLSCSNSPHAILFPWCSASLKYLFFSHLAKYLFFQLRNLCEKNKCPLILNCANEASITLFSGYSIYADIKSVVIEYEYKLFMKTVLCALNNALLLITLSHNSWRTLRSPLQIFKKMTSLKQEFCFLKGCI